MYTRIFLDALLTSNSGTMMKNDEDDQDADSHPAAGAAALLA